MNNQVKEQLSKTIDRIVKLKLKARVSFLSKDEDEELKVLEVKKGKYYAQWKD